MYSAGKPSPVVIGFFSNFTSSGEAFFRNLTRLHIPKGESGSCVAVSTYTQWVGWFTAFDLPEISYLLRKGKRSLKDASSSSRKFLKIKSWMIVEKTSMNHLASLGCWWFSSFKPANLRLSHCTGIVQHLICLGDHLDYVGVSVVYPAFIALDSHVGLWNLSLAQWSGLLTWPQSSHGSKSRKIASISMAWKIYQILFFVYGHRFYVFSSKSLESVKIDENGWDHRIMFIQSFDRESGWRDFPPQLLVLGAWLLTDSWPLMAKCDVQMFSWPFDSSASCISQTSRMPCVNRPKSHTRAFLRLPLHTASYEPKRTNSHKKTLDLIEFTHILYLYISQSWKILKNHPPPFKYHHFQQKFPEQ